MEKNTPKQSKKEEKPIAKMDAIDTTEALRQAEKDIKKDLNFKPDPLADLDEGELARLEGEE